MIYQKFVPNIQNLFIYICINLEVDSVNFYHIKNYKPCDRSAPLKSPTNTSKLFLKKKWQKNIFSFQIFDHARRTDSKNVRCSKFDLGTSILEHNGRARLPPSFATTELF